VGDIVALIVNPDTGEVGDTLQTGDRIARKRTADYLSDTVELLPDEPYVKAYTRPMFELSKSLTGTEMQLVHFLLQYLSFESGVLKHENGQFLARSFVVKETGLSERTTDRALQGLRDKRILNRAVSGRDVQYFMNPYLFMRGKRINKTLHEMFKNSRWAKVYEI